MWVDSMHAISSWPITVKVTDDFLLLLHIYAGHGQAHGEGPCANAEECQEVPDDEDTTELCEYEANGMGFCSIAQADSR